jgi:PIN domain nuclease of toxin-antitoxin system
VKLLLDTHVLIWAASDPRRISPRVRRLLERPSTERWISPVTAWEVLLLTESGQLKLDVNVDEWLDELNEAFALREAPLTAGVVVAAREVTIPHRDPADRLLAATARFYDLRLVTADERLQRGKGFSSMQA